MQATLLNMPWQRCAFEETVCAFEMASIKLAEQGCRAAILSADEDGFLHTHLSPRTKPILPLGQRISDIVQVLRAVKNHLPFCGVALTVEELCPGGLDPTEGIAIAKALEAAGADFIIGSGGTKDFPALKWRKETQKKHEDLFDWDDVDCHLASPMWLVGRVSIPVFGRSVAQLIKLN